MDMTVQTSSNIRLMVKSLFVSYVIISLFGCGGGTSNNTIDTDNNPPVVAPQVNPTDISASVLKPATPASFGRLLKNGLYYNNFQTSNVVNAVASDSLASEVSAPASDSTDNFSQTITQEEGVDEMDIMKFDGHYLYVLDRFSNAETTTAAKQITPQSFTSPALPDNENTAEVIRVLQRENDQSLTEISRIQSGMTSENGYFSVRGMFLRDEQLIVIGGGYEFINNQNQGIWWYGDNQVTLDIIDTSSPSTPITTKKMTIEGQSIRSRRIDNYLLIVTSFLPQLDGISIDNSTVAAKLSGFDAIQAINTDALIPRIMTREPVTNEVLTSAPLFDANDCYIPQDADNLDSATGIISMTMVNLDDPTQIQTTCINGLYDDVYVTTDDIFIHANIPAYDENNNRSLDSTLIHHFARTTSMFSYNGTIELNGTLGWENKNLRLSATDTHLRAVTSEMRMDENDRFDHSLYMISLSANDRRLSISAQLPNNNAPAELGKPNEDIKAVRYFGDKAFIVTFETIDPLYVIDVSNPFAPVVTGELEMPGYSSYLHPINEQFILGIGQNVPAVGFDVVSSLVNANEFGAKVALFDVSGIPRIVNEFVFADSYSPAEFDYHALTYLAKSDVEHIFAMPMQGWTMNDMVWLPDNRLEIFEVDLSGNASMSNSMTVRPPDEDVNYYWASEDRAVVIGDTIYYVKRGQVWQTSFNNPLVINGPY